MIVESLNGDLYQLRAISRCTQCGDVPHLVGEHGSLTCQICGSAPRHRTYQAAEATHD